MIRQQAAEKGVDAALIAAVIYSESKFSDQTSSAGARGLMQITPEAAKEIAAAQRRHHLQARRPLRPRNQHPLRHLPAARTARSLRRRRGRGARRLQRRPRQRRQVGRQRASPSATSPSRKLAPTSKRFSKSATPTATSTPGSWATGERRRPEAARRRPGPGGRPGPGRLLGRRPGAAGDLPRPRHQHRRRHLGADLLQPGDGAGRGAGGAAGPPGRPRPRGRRRPGDLRRRRPRLRPRRQALDPDPRPLRAGARRRRSRSPRRWSCCRRRSAPSAAPPRSGPAPGATGAALGPAVGGILTELVSWQSIFLLQVPVALAAAVPILAVAKHEAATGILEPSCAAPAARTSPPTSPWRWSRRRSPRRSSCWSCC